MVTHAIPSAARAWSEELAGKEEMGEIQPPFVDWIRLHLSAPPTIVLVAPGLIEGVDEVAVRVEAMPGEDRVALEALIAAVAHYTKAANLSGIFHLGGLDYSFCSGEREEGPTLKSLNSQDQPHVWGLLRAIAVLGCRYLDVGASTPKRGERLF